MNDTQTIKDRIDIVQFIQEYVPLKKSGVNWKANCPFHSEKSPSFMVHPEKQIWHCFGCGKGGDIFTFLQEMEGLEFKEALKLLAARAGVVLDQSSSQETNSNLKNRLREINQTASYFFHRFLLDIPASKPARDYLQTRGVTEKTLEQWQIGYIPKQWDLLTKYLLKKGFGIDDLVQSGLTIKREGADQTSLKGYYDRFRGRIMFPIYDIFGQVVGFTGRILVEEQNSGGKYVNTPQTPLYDKSRALYGIHIAKQEIKAKDEVIVVEGQMDVIASHQAGMKNVVAASGTALTIEQIKILKRYTTNLVLAFDADLAGENAGKRGIAVALEEGMNIRIIQLPEGAGKDADEVLKKNPQVWFQSVKDARDVMDWYFTVTFKRIPPINPKSQQQVAQVLLEQISHVPSPVVRDHWLKVLGDRLGVDRAVLREEMKTNQQDKSVKSSDKVTAQPAKPRKAEKNRLDNLRGAFLALLFKFPKLEEVLDSEDIGVCLGQDLAKNLYDLWKVRYNGDVLDTAVDSSQFSDELLRELDLLFMQGERDYAELSKEKATNEIKQLAGRIKEEWKRSRRKELQLRMKQVEQQGDQSTLQALLDEFYKL